MKRFFITASVFLLSFIVYAQQTVHHHNCFTILVGRNASADSSVYLAHNEDDGGDQIVNWYKVPGQRHALSEPVTLKNGASVPQVEKTNAYLWLQMPGQDFADSYMNEYGVVIASNQCSSKEANAELTEGGIGYWLRRLMVERAKTAREAVEIGGALVEKYGYYSSGRTYCVADENEAWMMAVVKGKHWVAQRVPDNEIAIIPNYYIITRVDLKDTVNFMGSSDIIDYAIQRGWHQGDKTDFNFRESYSHPDALKSMSNIARQWRGTNLLVKEGYRVNDPFPFSFVPGNKMTKERLMEVLEDTYHKTRFEADKNEVSHPHQNEVMTICSNTNQYGFVAQLRDYMPAFVGCVMWIAPRRPDVQPFIPWYSGIQRVPKGFARDTDIKQALEGHFNIPDDLYERATGLAFWSFVNHTEDIDKEYHKKAPQARKQKHKMEKELFKSIKKVEKMTVAVGTLDRDEAYQIVTRETEKWAKALWEKESPVKKEDKKSRKDSNKKEKKNKEKNN